MGLGSKKSSKLKKLNSIKDFKINSRSASPNVNSKHSSKSKELKSGQNYYLKNLKTLKTGKSSKTRSRKALAQSIDLKRSVQNHNSHRHSNTNSRKSRIRSSSKKYSSGVGSGKRYNSLGTSGNLGRANHHHSFGSMSKDGRKNGGGFIATQQRIKDLIDKNSRSKSNYRSNGRELKGYNSKKGYKKGGLEMKPDRLSRYFKRNSGYPRSKPAQQILDSINLNNRNDLKSKIRRVRGSLDSNLNNYPSTTNHKIDRSQLNATLGIRVKNKLKNQFKSQRNDSHHGSSINNGASSQ